MGKEKKKLSSTVKCECEQKLKKSLGCTHALILLSCCALYWLFSTTFTLLYSECKSLFFNCLSYLLKIKLSFCTDWIVP